MDTSSDNVNRNVSKEDMVAIISRHEVFSGLNQKEKSQLKAIVSFRSAKAKDIIFEIDDAPDTIFYLLEGSLSLHFPDNSKLVISPGELIGEIGILNGDFRLGRLVSEKDSKLIAIYATSFFEAEIISPDLSLKIVRRLSRSVTNYLRSIQQTSSKEIISAGENDHIEFKSSLRWNLKANQKDERLTHAVLKTIAAFLNSDGGTLVVGVADDGVILGLEHDRFENEDKILLFLTNVIQSKLGTLHLENINYHIERIQGKIILRVDVQASNTPCYLITDKFDHFYIRTGPSTTDLRLRNLYGFIKKRFG